MVLVAKSLLRVVTLTSVLQRTAAYYQKSTSNLKTQDPLTRVLGFTFHYAGDPSEWAICRIFVGKGERSRKYSHGHPSCHSQQSPGPPRRSPDASSSLLLHPPASDCSSPQHLILFSHLSAFFSALALFHSHLCLLANSEALKISKFLPATIAIERRSSMWRCAMRRTIPVCDCR